MKQNLMVSYEKFFDVVNVKCIFCLKQIKCTTVGFNTNSFKCGFKNNSHQYKCTIFSNKLFSEYFLIDNIFVVAQHFHKILIINNVNLIIMI